jgi:hypothetical protein
MPLSASKKKLRIKTQLEREWGQKAYAYGYPHDYKYDHAERAKNKLVGAGFRAIVMGSIRQEYADRDYYNVWTTASPAMQKKAGVV